MDFSSLNICTFWSFDYMCQWIKCYYSLRNIQQLHSYLDVLNRPKFQRAYVDNTGLYQKRLFSREIVHKSLKLDWNSYPGCCRKVANVTRDDYCVYKYVVLTYNIGDIQIYFHFFIQLYWVFIVARGIFLVVACELQVAAYGIQFLDQRLNLGPLHWECTVLAIGPPGMSAGLFLISSLPFSDRELCFYVILNCPIV